MHSRPHNSTKGKGELRLWERRIVGRGGGGGGGLVRKEKDKEAHILSKQKEDRQVHARRTLL